jgi:membrane protein
MTQDNKKVSQSTKEALSVESERQERQERVTEVLQGAGFDPEFYRLVGSEEMSDGQRVNVVENSPSRLLSWGWVFFLSVISVFSGFRLFYASHFTWDTLVLMVITSLVLLFNFYRVFKLGFSHIDYEENVFLYKRVPTIRNFFFWFFGVCSLSAYIAVSFLIFDVFLGSLIGGNSSKLYSRGEGTLYNTTLFVGLGVVFLVILMSRLNVIREKGSKVNLVYKEFVVMFVRTISTTAVLSFVTLTVTAIMLVKLGYIH